MSKVYFVACIVVAMTHPSVLVNTYVEANDKPFIDFVSKVFIIGGLFLGINRLRLFGNIHIVFLIFSLSPTFLFVCYYSFYFYSILYDPRFLFVIVIHYVQWAFIVSFNLVSKRLKRYYNELNVFDKEVGCRPRIGKPSIRNLIETVVILLFLMTAFALPQITNTMLRLYLSAMPFAICTIQEVHYYGHLLSLLIPRMRLINYYMELPLVNSNTAKTLNVEEFGYSKADTKKSLCEMEKMMNLYHKMITAHNYLVEAVKWQLLVILICTFLVMLVGTYTLSLLVIHEDITLFFMLSFMLISGAFTLSLFSPCVLGGRVRYEVARLRELLAARIYENQMDKCSRGMARALLAWTETRDLSFSLLRMLDIDISLPFKFVGLLVTYLIILLQFQKIIDPDA